MERKPDSVEVNLEETLKTYKLYYTYNKVSNLLVSFDANRNIDIPRFSLCGKIISRAISDKNGSIYHFRLDFKSEQIIRDWFNDINAQNVNFHLYIYLEGNVKQFSEIKIDID